MFSADAESHAQIEALYREWIGALQRREYDWFERHLADDYTCTARPFAGFHLDKRRFIEADKKVAIIEVEFVAVLTHRVGTVVFSNLVLRVLREAHSEDLGDGLPSAEDMSDAVSGKTVAYASAWRFGAGRWQCFDHHLIGAIE